MSAVARCPACGAFMQAGDRFCWSCGLQIGAAQPTSAGPTSPPAAEVEPEVALALRRAYLAQQRGRLEEAEELVRGALRNRPDSVPALSMLARVLRMRGDAVGAVAAAQRVSELVGDERRPAPPGAVARAREDRAQVEQQVVREVVGGTVPLCVSPLDVLAGGAGPHRTLHAALGAAGLAALFLAMVAVLRGTVAGYLWFAVSMLGAGWCYHDAETRGLAALLWAMFALVLGPFGLAIYLFSTRQGFLR